MISVSGWSYHEGPCYTGDMITIDEFQKVELKIGRILKAENIEGSEKLLKLNVDLGEPEYPEGRQILSGIAKQYKPEDLIDKQIVVVSNLEPRTMMGMESRGMILAAGDDGQISLIIPDKEIKSGSSVK